MPAIDSPPTPSTALRRRPSLPAHWRSRALVTLGVLGSSTAGCCECDVKEEPTPGIASIELVPAQATVSLDSRFQVRAVFRDKDGAVIAGCDCYDLDWSLNPADGSLTKFRTDPNRNTATFEATDQFTQPTKLVTITATLPGTSVQDSSDITIVNVAEGDVIVSDGDRGQPLDVALVTGIDASGCFYDRTHAFAGVALLGSVDDDPICLKDDDQTVAADGNVAIFSADWKVLYSGREATFGWTAGDELIDHRSKGTGPSTIQMPGSEPIPVSLVVWIPDDIGTPAAFHFIARRDVWLASKIFLENKAGMEFEMVGGAPRPLTLVNGATGNPCAQLGTGALAPIFSPPPAGPDLQDGTVIHVVYVRTSHPTWAGAWCVADPVSNRVADVIFIDVRNYTPTTLAHELGHAMSLNQPCVGHPHESTYTMPGFDERNLMWSKYDHDQAAFREHLSLGQAFRMSIDKTSWVNRADHPTATAMPPRLREGELPAGLFLTEVCDTDPVDPNTYDPEPYPMRFCPKLYQDLPTPTVVETPLVCP